MIDREPIERLTIGELRRAIEGLEDDHEIDFGSTLAAVRLEFYRFKSRGEKLLQIELNERFPKAGTYSVTVDESGPYIINAPHLE